MAIKIIYARSNNHCIGHNGSVPWKLPAEFQHFLDTIRGGTVIMGRISYEDHDVLLPHCKNVVITRQKNLTVEREAEVFASLEEACNAYPNAFVIGGSGLITEAMNAAETVFETVVHTDIKGDTFLPAFDFKDFSTRIVRHHTADQTNPLAFTIYRHQRVTNY